MMSDISEIESKIKKLREEANKRAASLINIQTSQEVVAERDYVFRAKESVEAECSKALVAKQQLLRQAQCEDAVLKELEEKIDALTRQVEILETRINELSAVIAEKDELIVTLTVEKLQLEESIKNAEKNAHNALETGRAWQAAATEEISAHAVTARDRDSLMVEIEQLEHEIQQHAEIFRDELHEQELAARIQSEQPAKAFEYHSQKTDSSIKDIGIDKQTQEAESDSESERVAADHADTPMLDPPQCEPTIDILESRVDVNPLVLAIEKTTPGAEMNTISETTVIPESVSTGNTLPFSRKLQRGPRHSIRIGKSYDVVRQNIKNNLDLKNDRTESDLEGRLNPAALYNHKKQEHPKKQAAKAWQNKVEEYLAISNNGSIRWDRSPGEREGMGSRANLLESNVRKLAELSMAGMHAESQPAGNTTLSVAPEINENQDISSENKAALRKRASIVVGLGTMAVVFGLLALAARDETAFAQPLSGLFSKHQSGMEKTHQGRARPDAGDHQLQPQDQSNGLIKQKPAAVSTNDTFGVAVYMGKYMAKTVL